MSERKRIEVLLSGGSRLSFRARCVGAGVAAAIAYVLALFRFLTYEQREHLGPYSYAAFSAMAMVAGFLFASGAGKNHFRIAGCVLLGAFLAHGIVVSAEIARDPTDHNLLPFEFLILAVFAVPSFVGAFLAKSLDSNSQ